MSDSSKAVFLSYASQDAEAARRICDALRAAGVEVWFDQSELRGGDTWDHKIRKQIKECALFVPVISAHTNSRPEGYFRLEWKLAVDRSHLLADDHPFLFPVVVDDTPEAGARVPEKFRDVQWTRLNVRDTPETLAVRVNKLLSDDGGRDAGLPRRAERGEGAASPARGHPAWLKYVWISMGLVFAFAYGLRPLWRTARPAEERKRAASTETATPLSATRKLVDQAKALIDDDPLAVRENFLTAKRLGERAIDLDPGEAEAYAVTARASCQLILEYRDSLPASLAAARSRAESAIRLAPSSVEAVLALATVDLVAKNRLAEVAQRLERLRERVPEDRRVLHLLQLAALFQDHVAEAQQWVDRAVALPGGDPDSLNNRAGIFWSLNNYPQLAATLEQSLAQRTTAVACHYKLMLLVWGWGDLPAGREWVEQMPGALLQEDRVAMLAFLTWYWSRQPDRALEVLQRFPRPFIEQGALFVSTDYLAGCAQLLAGHPEAAQLAFATGLKAINERAAQDPSNRRVLFEKTRLLARLGQRPEAAHSLRVLQELAGAEATSASYAELLVLTGSNAEAMAVAERGIDRRRSRWPVAVNHLRNDPVFDPLRPDPRFQALIAKGEAQLAELRASGGPAAAVTPAPDAKSVAVLAFANLSDDKANEYFSDGISEELLTVLQKIPGLHVAARTSAFSFKGKSATAREIGQKLGVANLVEGSVQKSGSRVKVTARLSRVSTGEEQWSQSYTRELKDVFALQEELALAIVGELRGQLAGGDDAAAVKAAVKGGTTNAEAHQQYLQGRYFMNRFSVENMLRAISCFEQATALDPNFALAWAALARTHALHVGWADKLTRQEFDAELAQARRAADRALALEADLPEALSARFEIQFNYDFDWKAGAETMRRGLALAPSDPIMLGAASRVASIFGDRARALDLARQAVALDPVNSEIRVYLGLALLQVRQLPEARAEFARVAELNPTTPWAYAGSGLAYLYEGKYAEALTAAKPEATNFAGMLVAAIALQGQKKMAEADAALAQLIKEDADVGAYQIAEVYGFRGDKDQAFAWLDRAHRQRDAGLAVFNNDPFLDSVRSDPRWAAFQREMGLAEDQLK